MGGVAGGADAPQLLHWVSNQFILLPNITLNIPIFKWIIKNFQ